MSETSNKFQIGEPAKSKEPVKETLDDKTQTKTVEETMVEEGNKPYLDKRSVTISRVQNYCKYREANRTVMPKRADYIGSCIASSTVLASNRKEVESYFPNILGLSPNDPHFIERVKAYLNNIQIKIDEVGKTFDTSFYYYHKSDYDRIAKLEANIEERYKNANKSNISELKKALKFKIDEINSLETSKCEYGYPINITDYLMYRHCLYYNSVAKDPALINEDPTIRFYFKDDKREEEKYAKYRMEINKAKANFVTCISDNIIFDAVYIQYCLYNNIAINYASSKSRIEKETDLDRFSQAEPVKFNKIFNDKDLKTKSAIEMLITKGILIRSEYSQNITDLEGNLIGANMGEAIAWFKDAANNTNVNNYYKQLKVN